MPPDYPIQQRTEDFAFRVIEFVRTIPMQDSEGRILLSQLLRAGTSVGANVGEGQASPTRKDFANFHAHALKSSNETAYWLRLFDRAAIGDTNLRRALMHENEAINKILGRILLTIKRKR